MTVMSRYPFRECVNEVMSKYRGNRAASTLEVMERRYNRMARDLNQLRAEGRISTTSPKYLTVDDISVYHEFLRTRLVNGGHVCNDSIKKDFINPLTCRLALRIHDLKVCLGECTVRLRKHRVSMLKCLVYLIPCDFTYCYDVCERKNSIHLTKSYIPCTEACPDSTAVYDCEVCTCLCRDCITDDSREIGLPCPDMVPFSIKICRNCSNYFAETGLDRLINAFNICCHLRIIWNIYDAILLSQCTVGRVKDIRACNQERILTCDLSILYEDIDNADVLHILTCGYDEGAVDIVVT